MIFKLMRLMRVLTLGILLFLFACQLPGKLIRTISQMRKTVSPTQFVGGTISVSQSPLSPYPGTVFKTVYPGPCTGTTFPGLVGTPQPSILVPVTEYPGILTASPGKITQTIEFTETTSAHSGDVSGTPSEITSATITPSATGSSLVPAREGTISASPTLQTADASSYPGPEIQPSYTSYPGVESPPGLIPTLDTAYPSPEVATTNYSPTPTITFLPVSGSTITTTPSPKSSDISSTTTPILSTNQVSSSTPSPTVFFVPTVTLTPTRTPFRTPTPTITPTPTNTRTPLPFPPWISSKLSATDPRSVRLASGKVQLVQFFAYWNGPSQAMAPLLLGLEKEYKGRVNFVYLDIDNPTNNTYKRKLGFRMEPQFFLLDPQGKILKQWIGYVTVEQLRKAFGTALQ